jgi:hypothetical protein
MFACGCRQLDSLRSALRLLNLLANVGAKERTSENILDKFKEDWNSTNSPQRMTQRLKLGTTDTS